MPITLPQSFTNEVERPHGATPMLWLVEVELARAYSVAGTIIPSVTTQIGSYHEVISWTPAGHFIPGTFYPFNFSFTPIEQTQEGDLPQVDLTIDNAARTLMRVLHTGDGFEGNYCKVWLVPFSALGVNNEFQVWDLQVAAAFANDEAITFRLERANFFTRQAPQDRFVAARCRWGFGSRECGYVINSLAAFATCPKDVDSCTARGQDHRARGLPVLHPRRFGGFPGIPRQR